MSDQRSFPCRGRTRRKSFTKEEIARVKPIITQYRGDGFTLQQIMYKMHESHCFDAEVSFYIRLLRISQPEIDTRMYTPQEKMQIKPAVEEGLQKGFTFQEIVFYLHDDPNHPFDVPKSTLQKWAKKWNLPAKYWKSEAKREFMVKKLRNEDNATKADPLFSAKNLKRFERSLSDKERSEILAQAKEESLKPDLTCIVEVEEVENILDPNLPISEADGIDAEPTRDFGNCLGDVVIPPIDHFSGRNSLSEYEDPDLLIDDFVGFEANDLDFLVENDLEPDSQDSQGFGDPQGMGCRLENSSDTETTSYEQDFWVSLDFGVSSGLDDNNLQLATRAGTSPASMFDLNVIPLLQNMPDNNPLLTKTQCFISQYYLQVCNKTVNTSIAKGTTSTMALKSRSGSAAWKAYSNFYNLVQNVASGEPSRQARAREEWTKAFQFAFQAFMEPTERLLGSVFMICNIACTNEPARCVQQKILRHLAALARRTVELGVAHPLSQLLDVLAELSVSSAKFRASAMSYALSALQIIQPAKFLAMYELYETLIVGLKNNGDLEEAESCCHIFHSLASEVKGPLSEYALRARRWEGRIMLNRKKQDGAVKVFEEIIQAWNVLGRPRCFEKKEYICFEGLSDAWKVQGDLVKAAGYLKLAHDYSVGCYGIDSSNTQRIFRNLIESWTI